VSGFFKQVGDYRNQLSEQFNSIMNKIKVYLNTNNKVPTDSSYSTYYSKPSSSLTYEDPSSQVHIPVKEKEETKKAEDIYYWIVRIPIQKNENMIPLGKYEKIEEKRKNYEKGVKEKRCKKELKSVKGMNVVLCVRLGEEENEGEELEGSIMDKKKRMEDRIRVRGRM